VTAICRLAGETLPIVFCFDQVESLQRTAHDDEALFRFGRLAADLHDADSNIFIITCLQSAFLNQLTAAVRSADFERMAKHSVELEPLSRPQVESLILSRLGGFPELAGKSDRFYPLDEQFVEQVALETPCVPRRILTFCARAFEEKQHGHQEPRPTSSEFLSGALQTRLAANLETLEPPETQRVIVQAAHIIGEFENAQVRSDDSGGADVVIAGERSVALSVRNEEDGRSLTPKLKMLLNHVPRKDGARLVIVRDPRLPISAAAVKAKEHLKNLQERGTLVVKPTIEALAALDALASLLGDSKSGDLSNQEVAVDVATVVAWIKGLRNELVLEPVREFMSSMYGQEESASNDDEYGLVSLLSRKHMLELDAAAKELGWSAERTLTLARGLRSCLVLDGPPQVLLDVAGVPQTEVSL
jgi:hypothetical protein